jgi:hypothetical protein
VFDDDGCLLNRGTLGLGQTIVARDHPGPQDVGAGKIIPPLT